MATQEPEPRRRRPDARRDAYTELAERVGGTLVQGRMTGGYEVRVAHGSWTLRVGLHASHDGSQGMVQTRLIVRFAGREEFKLRVRRRTFLDRMVARLGFTGLRVGGRELLEGYVVRGRPTSRVRSAMSGGLGEGVLEADVHRVDIGRASWRIRRKHGPHARSLRILEPGANATADRLVQMVALGRTSLDVLERVGLATPGLGRPSAPSV